MASKGLHGKLFNHWGIELFKYGLIANNLDVHCSLDNSYLFCVAPDVSHVRHQGLFFCQACQLKEGHHPFPSSVRLIMAWEIFPVDMCLSNSLYSSTDRFASLAIVLHRSFEDDLEDVKSLRYSVASRPKGPWLPRVFMPNFLTIEALSYSNMD